MVEINTKAWKKKRLFFPNRQHFSLLRKFNIPVVVNADTHHPSRINDGRIDALHALLSEGSYTRIFNVSRLKKSIFSHYLCLLTEEFL